MSNRLSLFIGLLCFVALRATAQEPAFSHPHGLYDAAIQLAITCDDAANIYYTLDGSDPDSTSQVYTAPLDISSTAIVRAIAARNDGEWSNISTASFIFPQSVLSQGNTPEGYPDMWGPYCQITGQAIADYEMDPEMTNDLDLRPQIERGLYTLPIVSLVTNRDNFFSHERDEAKGGIYIYTGTPVGDPIGRGWERPVSFEFFGGPEEHDLTVDCCVKMHGGHGRLPEKNPKHAMRLHFKSAYGPSKLNYPVFGDRGPKKFNALVLRTFFGYSWQHWDNTPRGKAQYARDLWARYTQQRMGDPISLGQYVHLFINGMYWGIYNMSERVTADFCQRKFGGEDNDWDIVEVDGGAGQYHAAFADYGTVDKWNEMCDLIYTQPNHDDYLKLIGANGGEPLLDIDNYIDFMLINQYAGNTDWDHHNWYAYRNRTTADTGFRFICWDTEMIFDNIDENLTTKNNRGCPTGFLNRLMRDRLFAHHFHERAQAMLDTGGPLSPQGVVEIWDSLSNSIGLALYDEAARWGDYRRDVHPHTKQGDLYTVDYHYFMESQRLHNEYFPQRTDILIQQLRERGWFPEAPAPKLLIDDIDANLVDSIEENAQLTFDATTVYYTLDGSDPVHWQTSDDGTIGLTAKRYTNGTNALRDWKGRDTDTLIVKAINRANKEWSPIVTKRFIVQHPDGLFALQQDTPHPHSDAVYDLQGRYLCNRSDVAAMKRLPPGIYIQNGKKVVVK